MLIFFDFFLLNSRYCIEQNCCVVRARHSLSYIARCGKSVVHKVFKTNNTNLFFYVDIRHWPMQIYYMNVINISTINNYLQSG